MRRRYPKEFYVQRRRIIARDHNRCVLCWREWQLDVHHYWDGAMSEDYPYLRSDLPDWMLVTLCKSCHGKFLSVPRDAPIAKLLAQIVQANRELEVKAIQ